MHISLQATDLQVHTHMLGICTSGLPQMGALQGIVPYSTQTSEMPPVGRLRLRPGSLEQDLAYNPNEDMTVEGNILELEFVLITILMDECSLKFAFSPRMETLDFDLLCEIHVVK